MLGIWMRHGRPGAEADESFDYINDTLGKQTMYDNAINIVQKYKNHPAILTWGIGNEVYLNIETDKEKIVYSELLERICSDIKKIDDKHPITSVEAWVFGADWWSKHFPSIDIYGVNVYAADTSVVAQELDKKGIDKPYIITEFGVRIEWEIEKDRNGVKPEPGDQEKYNIIADGYTDWIKNEPSCLGVYVFHYGNGFNFSAAWHLTHFNQMKRPQYWAIREAYTGLKPIDIVPEIKSFKLPGKKTKSKTWIPVRLVVEDQKDEIKTLEHEFYYNQRTSSRKRRDQLKRLSKRGNYSKGFEIELLKEHGGIKIYVMATDAYNNVGIASTSITVIDEKMAKKEFLVPKVELPFYVYQDNSELPYAPSAYMGNYENMNIDLNHKETVKAGETAMKISYNAKKGWYGFALVDPAGDWGDILGGYDISKAKTNYDNLKVKLGFGLIDDDKKFHDTAKKLIEIQLTDQWKKYTIKTKRLDLSCIRSGFVIFSSGLGLKHDIFLDEIVFQ